MIQYADGTEARIGDHVDFDGYKATVEHVLDTTELWLDWTMDEAGLVFRTQEIGLVFEASSSRSWDSIVFLSRASV